MQNARLDTSPHPPIVGHWLFGNLGKGYDSGTAAVPEAGEIIRFAENTAPYHFATLGDFGQCRSCTGQAMMIRTVRDIERTFESGQELELKRWHKAWRRSNVDDVYEELFRGFEGTVYFEGKDESWETAWDSKWAGDHFKGSQDYFCESTKKWNDSLPSMLKKLAEAGWVRIVLLPAKHRVEVHDVRAG